MLLWLCVWFSTSTLDVRAQEAFSDIDSQSLAVIANASVPVDTLSQQELLDLYSLDTNKWPNGSLVILFDQKSESTAKTTFYNFLNKREREMKKVWMRVVLSGEGRTPKVIREQQSLIRKVAETDGALGYVDLEVLKQEQPASIKVLALIPVNGTGTNSDA